MKCPWDGAGPCVVLWVGINYGLALAWLLGGFGYCVVWSGHWVGLGWAWLEGGLTDG
jgi:hypothetical protein